MIPATEALVAWLVDYYAVATFLLLGTGLAVCRQRQPARRLAICSSAIVGLVVLLAVCAVPSWPRLSVGPRSALRTTLSTVQVDREEFDSVPGLSKRPHGTNPRRPVLEGGASALPSQETPRSVRHDPATGAGRPSESAAASRRTGWHPLLARIFMTGSTVMVAWLALGCWQTGSLMRRGRPAPDRLRQMLGRVVGTGRPTPRLLLSADLAHPVAAGLWRPTILLPDRMTVEGQEDRVLAALRHEWAHIRNRDLWLVAFLRLLLPVLYAHPAYWWLRRRVRDDQEALADASAAYARGAVEYADLLLSWARTVPAFSMWRVGEPVALFERPSQLKWRIAMLLDRDLRVESSCPTWWRAAASGGAAAAVLGLSLLSVRPTALADAPPATAKTRSEAGPSGTGHVVGPDGRPVAGARVYLSKAVQAWLSRRPVTPQSLGTTAGDGSFRLPRPDGKNEAEPRDHLVAVADGYGPAFSDLSQAGAEGEVLRLVKDDVPIHGRILDTHGRPVAGAEVQVVGLLYHPSGELDAWIEALKKEQAAFPVQSRLLRSWQYDDVSRILPAVSTGRDGRFTLKGIGRERIAALRVSGAGIATSQTYVATRNMPMLKSPDFPRQNFGTQIEYHGAEFEMIADPGMVVSGTVTDHDTGKPLAHVRVETASLFGDPPRTLETRTDDQGRYRVPGIPARDKFGQQGELLAGPDDEAPYLTAIRSLGKWDGSSPVRLDFTLKRGVRVRGRVVNAKTGKGVRAGLGYYIAEDNPHLKTYPAYGTINASPAFRTDVDGAFTMIVMPGHGAIAARAWDASFRLGVGIDTMDWIKTPHGAYALYDTFPEQFIPINYHTVLSIDPKQGDETITCEIRLDPGKTVQGKVVGPDGAPLDGFRIDGLGDHFRRWTTKPSPTAEFLVKALGPQTTRDLFVYHEGKQLAGEYVVKPGEAGPITVKLEPCGTVTGRLVGADGRPLSGVEVVGAAGLAGDDFALGTLPAPIKTDADGRFRATGLIPGKNYRFHVWRQHKRQDAAKDVSVPSGQTKDLGDLRVALSD